MKENVHRGSLLRSASGLFLGQQCFHIYSFSHDKMLGVIQFFS